MVIAYHIFRLEYYPAGGKEEYDQKHQLIAFRNFC